MKDLKCELVRFRTKDNLELQGLLFEPEEKTKTVLVYVHGWTGNFYENVFIDYIAEAAVKNNLAFLTFSTRAAGFVKEFLEKKGMRTRYIKIGGSLEKFEDCLKDIGAATKFLEKRGYERFILQGHSTGAQKVAYYVLKKQDKRVKGLILMEPTDDPPIVRRFLGDRFDEAVKYAKDRVNEGKPLEPMPAWLPFGVQLSAQKFLSMSDKNSEEGRLFDYYGSIEEIRKLDCPILVVFGSITEYQERPEEKLMILKKALKNCKTKLFINANHWFFGLEKELGKTISEWIRSIV